MPTETLIKPESSVEAQTPIGTKALEARVSQLEERIKLMEAALLAQNNPCPPTSEKRGWRAFVGIDADDPQFEEAVRLGREWRFADSPKDEDEE